MWKTKHKDLGRIKQKSRHTIQYELNKPFPEGFKVTKLTASCGCTKPTFDPIKGVLTLKFTAPEIPKHLLYKGEYKPKKKVRMETNIGPTEFTFQATTVV